MNIVLFYSSIITGIGCFIVSISLHNFYSEYWIFYSITTIGIITSIVNHGTTYNTTRNIDRMFMVIAFLYFISFIDTYISEYKIVDYALLSSMVLLFITSKLPNISQNISNILHTSAHFIFLWLFTMILLDLSPEKQKNINIFSLYPLYYEIPDYERRTTIL